ncbi:triosephosphate isomerase [Nocardioides albertanoniae]|uniref:Triosephosphate isomerase n=1 Tax=Nocardioides albertanoniae TaxID=1175486 RepID=A0A543A476_9ACTN|nr:triose-phosphate isomerase [Nocardioides albertanoniae]TQL67377.1 triosephosphate isomerase [Nocardioides albertanoniae]
MTTRVRPPFFEVGPKNLLRRNAIEPLVVAAARAGDEHGVTVLVTVPTALIAPVRDLGTSALVLAQGMSTARVGSSMNRVTAESLVDAGAAGVMLNHDADPLDDIHLGLALERAHDLHLQTIVCAGTSADATRFAALRPSAVLFEPPELIGSGGADPRGWIGASTKAIHDAGSGVLAMHAGGVATPEIARSIMARGADGTGATNGVLSADDPHDAVRALVAATRAGWEQARRG